jgi:acyl-CoA synthetase (NDP forming)
LISAMPESMSPTTREKCLAAGIVPLQGQREALEALDLAGAVGETWASGATVELRIPTHSRAPTELAPNAGSTHTAAVTTLTEHAGKAALAAFGVNIPRSKVVAASEAANAAEEIGFPVVIKASGAHLEHKSELGAVVVNIRTANEAQAAAQRLSKVSDRLLVEQMIADGVAEIIVGMTVDPQFGQVLVIGAGGILTELLRDTATLLPPFTAQSIEAALNGLKVSKLLKGFRGRLAGDIPALINAVLACTQYAEANLDTLLELDINPVIVRPAGHGAVAVDALIRLAGDAAHSETQLDAAGKR